MTGRDSQAEPIHTKLRSEAGGRVKLIGKRSSGLGIRSGDRQGFQRRHLRRRQSRWLAATSNGAETGNAVLVVAMHPVPQCLPVHPRQRRRRLTRMALQDQG